jgi:malic enzyme
LNSRNYRKKIGNIKVVINGAVLGISADDYQKLGVKPENFIMLDSKVVTTKRTDLNKCSWFEIDITTG